MRFVRLLSTSCQRSKQALFEPYVRPLTSEQKAYLRKVERRYLPVFHLYLSKDMEAALTAYRRLAVQVQSRDRVLELLGAALKPLGGEFDVQDISILPVRARIDLQDFPIDFAIVDKQNPKGIPPGSEAPSIYDLRLVTQALEAAGFQGSVYESVSLRKEVHEVGPNPTAVLPFTVPWKNYKHRPQPRLRYPKYLKLTAPAPYQDLAINLMLPGPTLLQLHRWITSTLRHDFKVLLGSVWIMMRTRGMEPFTPYTLALMVLRFQQDILDQKPCFPTGGEIDGRWVTHDYRSSSLWAARSVQVDARFEASRADREYTPKPSRLLYEFLDFWGRSPTFYRDHFVSLREGGTKGTFSQRQDEFSNQSLPRTLTQRDDFNLALQPLSWTKEPLVVQDPFIQTHNHGESVPQRTLNILAAVYSSAATVIKAEAPFSTILRDAFDPPRPGPFTDRMILNRETRTKIREWYMEEEDIASAKPVVDESLDKAEREIAASLSDGSEEHSATAPDTLSFRRPARTYEEARTPRATGTSHNGGTRFQGSERVPYQRRPRSTNGHRNRNSPSSFGTRSFSSSARSATHSTKLLKMGNADAPPEVHRARKSTLLRLRNLVYRNYGDGYTVELFGSTRYGVSSANSDLDLVLIDSRRPNGFTSEERPHTRGVYDIRKLANILYRNKYTNIVALPKASVPIVKFRDPISGLDCDLNVNDRLGLLNTKLIQQYCDLSTVLRPMMKLIKLWAKPLGLNSPSRQNAMVTFSSYAFALMTIAFLQHRDLLPNLQAHLSPNPSDTDMAQAMFFFKRRECDARFESVDWAEPRQVHLEEEMLEWFRFWAQEYDYSEELVDIKSGGFLQPMPPTPSIDTTVIPEDSVDENSVSDPIMEALKMQTRQIPVPTPKSIKPKAMKCSLIDPFIRTKNVTKNVGHNALAKFRYECGNVLIATKRGEDLADVLKSNEKTAATRTRQLKKEYKKVDGSPIPRLPKVKRQSEDSHTTLTPEWQSISLLLRETSEPHFGVTGKDDFELAREEGKEEEANPMPQRGETEVEVESGSRQELRVTLGEGEEARRRALGTST